MLVLPYGSGEWDADRQTLSFEGQTYRLGDGPHAIPSCSVERLFLVV